MKVKFVVAIAGPHISFRPKQEAVLDDDLAAKWIKTGICVSNEPVPTVDTEAEAEIAQIEEIVTKKSKGKKN
jgi:hypothetical protein